MPATSRVIQISGTRRQWILFFDPLTTTDMPTPAARQFLAGGWLSMRDFAVLYGQIRKTGDPDGRTDGEWLDAALFGKLSPKPKCDETTRKLVQPPGLTTVQSLNLGWTAVPGNALPVIGTYQHLPVTSSFKYYFLTGLAGGYSEVAPPGQTTLGAWQRRIRNDPTIAPNDKPFLWRVFVMSAMVDNTILSPPNLDGFPAVVLPVLTAVRIGQYKKLRGACNELQVRAFYNPAFNFVTNVLGAAFPGP